METRGAIEHFLNTRRSRMVSERTIEAYEWSGAKLESLYPELPVDTDDLEAMFASLDDLSGESRLSLWRRLRTFFRWLSDEYDFPNPMQNVPAPRVKRKIPRTLTREEIDHLLESLDSRRDIAIFSVLLDTGIRVGELASMTLDSFRDDGLHVSGKTGERVVPISSAVQELASKQGDERGLWLTQRKPYRKLTEWGLKGLVRRHMRQAGFQPPKIGPHMLRHTFGVQWMLNGGDLSSLMHIMGHTDIETTMLYARMSNNLATSQHRKFSPMAQRSDGRRKSESRHKSSRGRYSRCHRENAER